MDDTNIPQFGVDDNCSGRIEYLRYHTGHMVGKLRNHLTSIKLNVLKDEIFTKRGELREALHAAYVKQSTIRIDADDCRSTQVPFRSFTFISGGYDFQLPMARAPQRRKRNTGNSHLNRLNGKNPIGWKNLCKKIGYN